MNNPEVEIIEADFNTALEYEALCVAAPKSGAVVMFVGLVRDFYEDDQKESIEHLFLQHYDGLTQSLCQEIIDEARTKFPFDAVRLIHRVGKLKANEQIVFVGIASQHRDNAFQASQFIMDYLKTRAALWKKEVGDRGEQWLGLKAKDRDAAGRW